MAGAVTPGRRIYPVEGEPVLDAHTAERRLAPGDYYRNGETFLFKLPLPSIEFVARLGKHTITEHEDGTITVSPSILSTWGDGTQNWHGWLERGVWREC